MKNLPWIALFILLAVPYPKLGTYIFTAIGAVIGVVAFIAFMFWLLRWAGLEFPARKPPTKLDDKDYVERRAWR